MPTLTVLAFTSSQAADDALVTVQKLHTQHLIELHDAAVVAWPAGKPNPSTRQIVHFTTEVVPDGMFWAMLFGLVFFSPLLGMDVGRAINPQRALKKYGIDDDFVRRVRDAVTAGTSALFLIVTEPVTNRFTEAMSNMTFETIAATVSDEGPGATAA